MTVIQKIKYLFSQYWLPNMILDYRFGRCSNIPKCCIWWYLFAWPWYVILDKCEDYYKKGRAHYIECPVCMKQHRKPNRLKSCEKCKKRDICDLWQKAIRSD